VHSRTLSSSAQLFGARSYRRGWLRSPRSRAASHPRPFNPKRKALGVSELNRFTRCLQRFHDDDVLVVNLEDGTQKFDLITLFGS